MVEYIDPAWEKENPAHLKLSTLLGVDSFSLSMLNPKNVVLAFHQYQWSPADYNASSGLLPLSNKIKEDKLFCSSYANLTFQLIPSFFSFLPLRLFDQKQVNTYFNHLTDEYMDIAVNYDIINELELVVLYKENPFQQSLRKLLFPDKTASPVFTSMLPFLMQQDIHDTHLFCRISGKSLLLFIFTDKFFQFGNQFYCNHIADFQYYILLVCTQFQLNPVIETLYVWGDCDEESEVILKLKSIFCRIKFLNAQLIIAPDTKTRIVSESRVLEHLILNTT